MKANTTFDERKARSVNTREEAEACLREFVREGFEADPPHHVNEHSRGFDLYLPWLIEVIEYVEPYPDKETRTIPQLQRLYMDAAWSLVTQGVLRPGPRAVSGDGGGDVYGKGFSVMEGTKV